MPQTSAIHLDRDALQAPATTATETLDSEVRYEVVYTSTGRPWFDAQGQPHWMTGHVSKGGDGMTLSDARESVMRHMAMDLETMDRMGMDREPFTYEIIEVTTITLVSRKVVA